MTEYTPDNWVVFLSPKMKGYRILAGWSGGYLGGDSWRINSGVERVDIDDHHYLFHGYTGSVYRCHKNAYCLRPNNSYIWNQLKAEYQAVMLPKEIDWVNFDWKNLSVEGL